MADEAAFGDEALLERAIDEEWITLADVQATPDDPAPVQEERRTAERRASVHAGLAFFVGALGGFAAIAVFTAFTGRDDRRPALERELEAERRAPVVVTPKTISKTCNVALVYAQRGAVAQAIARFESCLSPEREVVRQRIGQTGAAQVLAKAEKGQCDEAADIVAQVERIEAAGPAKAAFASLCDSRAREIENGSPGP
jgi:hypothetical protein